METGVIKWFYGDSYQNDGPRFLVQYNAKGSSHTCCGPACQWRQSAAWGLSNGPQIYIGTYSGTYSTLPFLFSPHVRLGVAGEASGSVSTPLPLTLNVPDVL